MFNTTCRKKPGLGRDGALPSGGAAPVLGDERSEVAPGGVRRRGVGHAGAGREAHARVDHHRGEEPRVAGGRPPPGGVQLESRLHAGPDRLAYAERQPVVERAVALGVEAVRVGERGMVGRDGYGAFELLVEGEPLSSRTARIPSEHSSA